MYLLLEFESTMDCVYMSTLAMSLQNRYYKTTFYHFIHDKRNYGLIIITVIQFSVLSM